MKRISALKTEDGFMALIPNECAEVICSQPINGLCGVFYKDCPDPDEEPKQTHWVKYPSEKVAT